MVQRVTTLPEEVRDNIAFELTAPITACLNQLQRKWDANSPVETIFLVQCNVTAASAVACVVPPGRVRCAACRSCRFDSATITVAVTPTVS
jgi:hypothetical protein